MSTLKGLHVVITAEIMQKAEAFLDEAATDLAEKAEELLETFEFDTEDEKHATAVLCVFIAVLYRLDNVLGFMPIKEEAESNQKIFSSVGKTALEIVQEMNSHHMKKIKDTEDEDEDVAYPPQSDNVH